MTTCVTIKMNITSFHLQWTIQRLLKTAGNQAILRYTRGYEDLYCDCHVYELSILPICVAFQQFVDRQNQSLHVCMSMAIDQEHPCTETVVQNGLLWETSNVMHNLTKHAPPGLIWQSGCATKEARHAVYCVYYLVGNFYLLCTSDVTKATFLQFPCSID